MTGTLDDLQFLDTVLALQSGEIDNVNRALAAMDAERFCGWCLRHQIGGLTYLLLEDSSLRTVGAGPVAARLRGAYLEQWARTERLRLNLAALDVLMREIGEEYLVLKGLPFAQRYYGSYDRRATGDLDIWVRRSRAAGVAKALEARGVARHTPQWAEGSAAWDHIHQVELELDGTGVELHHALRVHPTFRIDEDAIWNDRVAVALGESAANADDGETRFRTLTLSDEHALLLHLLGLHTDVQIGQVQGRWFVDLHQLLLTNAGRIDWDGFLAARSRDGTRRICVNALAIFLVLTRRDDLFPELSAAVARRRDDIVGGPDRAGYLSLLRGGSLVQRKRWPLGQYEGGVASAAAWWLAGMPHRIAAKPAAFAEDVSAERAAATPWDRAAPARSDGLSGELGINVEALHDTHLRFGSLSALIRAERGADVDLLRELFRLRGGDPRNGAGAGSRPDLVIHLFSLGSGPLARLRVPVRPVVEHPLEGLAELHEGVVHAWVEDGGRVEAFLGIDRARETRPRLLHSLMVVMNRLLARLGCYHLHAAAIGVEGATWLFAGGKGSGKSTISLALGRAGATVYSEDHVVVRAHRGIFHVSGCDGDLHLTAETERHFFDRSIDGDMVERAGVPKKRVDGAALLGCRPCVETRVRGVLFPGVGDRFAITPLPKEEALARLLAPLTERHRFTGEADREVFLGHFAELVETCDTWELSLSPDLSELARLLAFLSERPTAAPVQRGADAPPALAP